MATRLSPVHTSPSRHATRLAFLLATALAAGCHSADSTTPQTAVKAAIVEGMQQIGPWQYEYTVGAKGTRSEGYYGKLFYQGQEVPVPDSINRYYETPWGRLYWVGNPPVLFGDHGWMPRLQAREEVGLPLPDPATLANESFVVQLKVLTADALGTPDRLETDAAVLDALSAFDLNEAHVQTGWLSLGQRWTSLHDTKRWGRFEVALAGPDQGPVPSLAFRSTGNFTVDLASQVHSLDSLLTVPTEPREVKIVPLQAQMGALQVLRCTLSVVPMDDLELYLVCRVEE